ncbi:MAG: solute-binding protein [Deltaproteobacteria bacterium]|nr:solute-binding protein [Deltaproteobacteria bacterium]
MFKTLNGKVNLVNALTGFTFLSAFFLFSPARADDIRLATTTSTQNSGLLDFILPDFEKRTGMKVRVIAVGTGKALKLAERGDADVVLVHARKLEEKFVRQGHGVRRKKVMENDFVLVGPESDPSHIRGAKSIKEAMKRLKSCKAPFISRGDRSGTHIRELSLWDMVGGPPPAPCRLEVGQGQAAMLRIASEKQAYALTDRGTYLAVKGISDQLKVMFQGAKVLINPYHIIVVNPKKHKDMNFKGACKFEDWFLSPRIQKMIGSFKVKGVVLFRPVIGKK